MGALAALLEILITLMMLEYQLKGTEGIKEEFKVENIVKGSVFLSLVFSLGAALLLLSIYSGKGNALIMFFLFFLYFFLLFSSSPLFAFAFVSGFLTVLRIPYKLTNMLANKLARLFA